ncbi:MAG: phosphoenolpyruvate synthase [Bacteroidetes bacterium]|nr:phosphoenolpyruvate synthase [Bacteroidota bacterium]
MSDQEQTVFIKGFDEIRSSDLRIVGGKNASLGEMYNTLTQKGIKIPYGFATTSSAYWEFIYSNKLKEPISEALSELDRKNFFNLKEIGEKIRSMILSAKFPDAVAKEIIVAYKKLCDKHNSEMDVAVRSSATAEDLPSASFAGQHESFLNIIGEELLIIATHRCFASLFTDRAIKYREDNKFDHMSVALSVGVQKMVRSDLACSGVIFTIEPESGFKDIVHIAGSWGLGENIVQGNITPDEFYVFKPKFIEGKKAIVSKKLGTKLKTMIYAVATDHEPGKTIVNTDTSLEKQDQFVLNDNEINGLAQWALIVEHHYGKAMDLEWAKDGVTGEMFIVQARPETVHHDKDLKKIIEYTLKEKGKIIAKGNAVGNKIATGIARILSSAKDANKLKEGEVLVADMTNPDWDPILKKASAIITNKGGRTSHASIVARELDVVAVVGTGNASEEISDGQLITVSCIEGKTGYVYDGKLLWQEKKINLSKIKMPKTHPMFILGDPDKAFKLSFYPNKGVGLMRLEFIISSSIKIHPMALVKFKEMKDEEVKQQIEQLTHHYPDKEKYFVDKLSQAVATIACAFYPKDVIVRMSDFKSNEYANLAGGKEFEVKEENPMIGFRGASRYYNERYREGFRLECEAMKVVRDEMGLTNIKLMIPFCRTVEEGKKVVNLMSQYGLKRGVNNLEIYMMIEIPSNVLLADEFSKVFDGFSIGSNDLTQLTLGLDRDSSIISDIFSEQNPAVEKLIVSAITSSKKNKKKIGLCGQASSDFQEFARFLVECGIDSISFNPDALLKGINNICKAEESNRSDNVKL